MSINFGPFCIVDLLLYISVTVLDSRAKMAIVLKLDEVMAERGMSLGELAERVGITNVNMSRIKTGKVKAVRFSTLDAICRVLGCEPGDVLKYEEDADDGP